MRSIQTVCEEHRALREVLDALELILRCQRADDRLDADLALEALEWLERFSDGLHQDREELGLFPALLLRAPDRTREVLASLLRWHADERARILEMRARIEGAAYGDACSRDAFTCAALEYIELQRRHSQVEDAQILPLAREVLLPEDDARILAEYQRIEQRHLRPGEPAPSERSRELVASAAHRVLERQASLLPARSRSLRPAPQPPSARA
ncbi:MAG: hemerythrin domain-containing protein [Planctomycetes bacterium]|nr:hemerythrin domain-containing protein [Planctomycetota bacterium]